MTETFQILFAYVMIYATAVTCTKASIVMFYGRIFNFRRSLAVGMFLVIGYWITIIVTISVACRPLPYFWLAYTNPTTAKGVCIDVPTFFFGNGIAAMLIDVIILCMPMPIIYRLHMPPSQKVAVAGILLLGSLYVSSNSPTDVWLMAIVSALLAFVELSRSREIPTGQTPRGRWRQFSSGLPSSRLWASCAHVFPHSGLFFAAGGPQCG